jgi:hypothetical protein
MIHRMIKKIHYRLQKEKDKSMRAMNPHEGNERGPKG